MHERLADLLKSAGFSEDRTPFNASTVSSSSSSAGQQANSIQAIKDATQAVTALQVATQGSVDSVTANTDALTQASQSHSSSSAAGTAGNIASSLLGGQGLGSGLLGGGLGLLFDGIKSLFQGSPSQPPPLTPYTPPPSQHFELATSNGSTGAAAYDSNGFVREAGMTQLALSSLQPGAASAPSLLGDKSAGASGASSPSITVNVHAMDSRSFLDHSSDIASAVREAMLNMHSINDVVNDL